ncbi:hypothetical protein RDABS01_032398 [Bienertia sinuspersici]
MKVIFPFTKQFHLPNLKAVDVKGCKEVEEIFESDKDTQPKPILNLPNLKELFLFDLPKLGTIYRGLLLCDELWPTMELIISNTELRETLQHDFPQYAFLSYMPIHNNNNNNNNNNNLPFRF